MRWLTWPISLGISNSLNWWDSYTKDSSKLWLEGSRAWLTVLWEMTWGFNVMSTCTKSVFREVPPPSTVLDAWYSWDPLLYPHQRINSILLSGCVRGSRAAKSGRERIWKPDSFLTKRQPIFLFRAPPSPLLPGLSHAANPQACWKQIWLFFGSPECQLRIPFSELTKSVTAHPFVPRLPYLCCRFFFSPLSLRVYPLKCHLSRCAGGSRGKCVCPSCHFKLEVLKIGSHTVYSPEQKLSRPPGFTGKWCTTR